jgi:hypothetical protein
MKKFYLYSILMLLAGSTMAQSFNWAVINGRYAYDYGYGMGTDIHGNVYTAGKFEQNAIFGGDSVICQGNHDIYLVQYDSSGNKKWIRTAGGPLGDYAHAMACDRSANVYVAGEIEGTDPIKFVGTSTTLTGHGGNDAFIAKYDLTGNLLWAVCGGGAGDDKAQAVGFDAAGNSYITGFFEDTAWFGNFTLYSQGTRDIFIVKYDPNGNCLWAKSAGSTGIDEGQGMICDASGNVYLCGRISNGATFGSTTITNFHNTNYFDAYVAKYATDGTLSWVKNMGGDVDDDAWAITMDANGKIYATGEYNAYAEFGSSSFNETSKGMADVFTVCMDASGNTQWVNSMGGPLIDRARGIV